MFFILDRKEQIVGVLNNEGDISKITPFFEDVFIEDLNTGSTTLEFATIGNTKEAYYLQVGNYIAFKDENGYQVLQITSVEEEHDAQLIKRVYCEGMCLELINEVVRPLNIPSANIRQYLTSILSDTSWSVGMVDIGLSTVHSIELSDYENVYKALQDVAVGKFGAEIRFRVDIQNNRIVAKYVDVFAQRGRVTKHRFEYGVNMTKVKKSVDTSELCTALIGVGNNNITFKEAQADDKPKNQDFIISQDAYDRWNNKGSHIMGVFKAETDSPEELLYLTRKELQRRAEPKITYEMDVEILGKDVRLGDEVFVIDTEFSPMMLLSARVSELEKSKTNGGNKCKLSNFKPVRSNITDDMRALASKLEGKIDGIVNSKFPIGTDDIQDEAITSDKIGQQVISSTHISNLSADLITTGTLNAELINVTNINADNINTGTLDAQKITVTNLDANEIKTGTLDASKINVTNLNADNITSGVIDATKVNVTNLDATNINTGTLDANRVNVSNLSANSITTGTIDASKIAVNNLNADKITSGSIDASKVTVKNLDADKIVSGTIDASKINVTNIDASNITSGKINAEIIEGLKISADEITTGTLDASLVNVINLNASNIVTGTIDASKIKVTNLSANNITSGTIDASKVTVTNLDADNITSGSIDASVIGVTNLNASNITSGIIDASKVNVTNLNASNITSGSISSDRLNVKDGFIQSGMIGSGQIGNAHIVDGTISGAKITSATITNAQIKDATIESGKIKSLNANKITSGTIDTSKITVSGTNGKLKINNNRLQVFDAQSTPVERVSIGDVNNNGTLYGLRVRGADGQTVLYDENGVYSEGITDGAITNPKISDESITGNKLNVDDIFANTGFIGALSTVSIDADQITTGKISGDRIDINGLISFEALDNDINKNFYFDPKVNKTFINGGNIYANSVTADKVNAKGLTVKDEADNVTFSISQKGDADIKGTISSFDYKEGVSGYKLTPTGDAFLNNATVRGSVILPESGMTDDDLSTIKDNDKQVRFWSGATFEGRKDAPFRVLQDGTVIATKGEFNGTVTGSIDIGNIRIEDTNSTKGAITISSIDNSKKVIELNEDLSFIDTNLIIGNSNSKMVEFDKSNKGVTIKGSDISFNGGNSKYFNFPKSTGVVSEYGYTSDTYGDYKHELWYTQGTLYHNAFGSKKEGVPDYKFTRDRGESNVDVEIDGELSVKTKITINNKIEMVARTTEDNNSGFDFIIK